MDKLNINNLPAEILIDIFRYINVGNRKNATIVCQLWNNLIKSAFRWSLELKYDEHDSVLNKDSILATNLKFGTIKICERRLNEDDQIAEIFKKHGFNVVELYLYGCRVDNLAGLGELLNFTPNLKHITLDVEISPDSSEVLLDQLLPDLPKLKSLVIYESDYRIINCFRKAKLSRMEIWEGMPTEQSLMVDFLSTQDKLTSLNVDSDLPSASILIDMGKLNVPFRLTQLSTSGIICQKQSQDYDHMKRFIKSQAGYLTEIELKERMSNSVLECLFANMSKLTTLWMKTYYLPRDNDFYDRLEENCNVHTLRLIGFAEAPDFQFVGNFLQKLPNIRCLILRYVMYVDILVMAQRLTKLESLYIDSSYGTSLNCVKFFNLKTLYIKNLARKINWNEFSKAHPLLIDLTVVRMREKSYLTSEDIDQITNNVDLQHITLGTGFVADNRFFEIVGSKCANLKVLDLDKSCMPQNLKHYLKIDVLRLRDSITLVKGLRDRNLM